MLDDKSPWFKGFCSVKEKKVKTIKEFQEVIGYEFENESLLRQALTHSSYENEVIRQRTVGIFGRCCA